MAVYPALFFKYWKRKARSLPIVVTFEFLPLRILASMHFEVNQLFLSWPDRRIHGYPSRVQVGGDSDSWPTIHLGQAEKQETPEKVSYRPTNRKSGLLSRVLESSKNSYTIGQTIRPL